MPRSHHRSRMDREGTKKGFSCRGEEGKNTSWRDQPYGVLHTLQTVLKRTIYLFNVSPLWVLTPLCSSCYCPVMLSSCQLNRKPLLSSRVRENGERNDENAHSNAIPYYEHFGCFHSLLATFTTQSRMYCRQANGNLLSQQRSHVCFHFYDMAAYGT